MFKRTLGATTSQIELHSLARRSPPTNPALKPTRSFASVIAVPALAEDRNALTDTCTRGGSACRGWLPIGLWGTVVEVSAVVDTGAPCFDPRRCHRNALVSQNPVGVAESRPRHRSATESCWRGRVACMPPNNHFQACSTVWLNGCRSAALGMAPHVPRSMFWTIHGTCSCDRGDGVWPPLCRERAV